MEFDLPKEQSSIIKVIGVGGGGYNAVNHMFNQGIKDVNFVICTDSQALDTSPTQQSAAGPRTYQRPGAGFSSGNGKRCYYESLKEIKEMLEKNTEMVFVTGWWNRNRRCTRYC